MLHIYLLLSSHETKWQRDMGPTCRQNAIHELHLTMPDVSPVPLTLGACEHLTYDGRRIIKSNEYVFANKEEINIYAKTVD